MSPCRLELVLDPVQCTHHQFAERLQQRLRSDEHLQIIPWTSWLPGPCRSPGSTLQAPITLHLAPASWQKANPGQRALPSDLLVVAELLDDCARELGSGTGLDAPVHGAAASRFGVFSLSSGVDGPALTCLLQIALPSLARWRHHQQRCLLALADYLLWWLRLCAQQQRLHLISPIAEPMPLQPASKVRFEQRLQARRRWLSGSLRRRLHQVRHRHASSWHIAIGRIDPADPRLQIQHQLPPCGADWFADPFLVSAGQNLWLFCERWDAAAGKGVIDLFAVLPDGLRSFGTVIQEPFHLSFPRLVQHRGEWFATVESAGSGEVRLYRADPFPDHWILERILLHDQAWIDPILISASDGWWLLVNSHNCPALPGATASELHLFHSLDLLAGSFQPHPWSPLLVDSTSARNGGLLNLNGCLIRVGQCTGIDNAYGESVCLRRIEAINLDGYREYPVKLDWLHGLKRQLAATHLHTLNNAGPWLALDYVSQHPTPSEKHGLGTWHDDGAVSE